MILSGVFSFCMNSAQKVLFFRSSENSYSLLLSVNWIALTWLFASLLSEKFGICSALLIQLSAIVVPVFVFAMKYSPL